MRDSAKASRHRGEAARLNEVWCVGAAQARYSDDGHWYATLSRFPAALFDPSGYLYFATEEDYLTAPIKIGKQISVPKPGICALSGYVRFTDSSTLPASTSISIPIIDEVSATEGRELLRLHRLRERRTHLVARKKRSVYFEAGRLACEVCGFDFAAVYGPLGEGFAECHHTLPLAQSTGERRTRLSDLAVVCANCHRMLHRRPQKTVAMLRELVRSRRDG